ncbi:putative TIM-barrel fold metal-dependent hydrolase [Mycobacteroides abscessus subsp. abscessus]|uniref:amidohydrolase n=1 Tax=Mycobacteroides abscessus TaxID=36809 RepID=UPI0009A8E79E|nr:amidohydrolase family protein [Mycobacteroides abscessus]SLE88527.1 putative TIM-barrel fold metal-dependent hydrolase [Mycobacteroides abscessus subsp. abscessus]SLF09925.1 putative TIM-barrel fold metal-dependent hydrolase [Mycobacteroides abscessus subsp. abscessus]SLF44443.1 putative TIM-barrel fold metal-dependent hydrolase [Mycobacteroides abscessus subsp. abscessus]SLF67181.1 putative TIM-barrel fold metal-dependent hydrolase [Mycobacteroides abscessus subsp. abscessus]SLG88257.1 put
MTTTLITGGQVITFDSAVPEAEALVLSDGRVVAMGDRRDMEDVAGPDAHRVDAGGGAVLPGLVDTHPHAMHFGMLAGGLVDLTDAVDHADIVARIRAKAAETPAGEWIMCTPVGEPHYFIRRSERDLAERRLPDRWVLDTATDKHPVMIQAWAPRMPNVVAFNSAGLRTLGLTALIPHRVCDVEIDRNENGDLTGILRGPVTNYYTYDPFWGQILTKLPRLNLDNAAAGTVAEISRFTAQGVTSLYEGHAMEPEHVELYRHLRNANALNMRVMATFDVESAIFYPFDPMSQDEFTARLRRLAGQALELDDDMLRLNGLTMSPGGPCFSGYFALYEPYNDPFGRPTTGTRFLSLEKEEAFVRFCATEGIRANICVGALREHDEFLDIAERVVHEHDFRDQRWILQHAITITPKQARRYADLGFQVTTCAGFTWGKGAMYGDRIGQHIWRDLEPLQRLMDTGLLLTGGTDWGPKNPWEQIELAETHRFAGSDHRNDGADQKISRMDALKMWTSNAATLLDWPEIGALAPGKYADVIITDRNPLTCPIDELRDTHVLRTYLGGETVYDSGELASPAVRPETALA